MSDTPHEMHESRILRTELLWAFGVGIFVAASLSMIVFTALTINVNPPSNVERIDPKTAWPGLKLLMVTTETEMAHVRAAITAGANEYVMKPFTKEVLIAKLQMLDVFEE